jgi:long-chain fatty acid transport protein
LFGVYGLSDDVKLGFSVNSYAGGSLDYDSSWSGRYYVQRADLLTLNFNPAVAYRVSPLVSVGAGFSVQYAKLVQKVAINNGILDPASGDGRLTFKDATVGFGGNAGVLIEPIEGTRVGLTYRSPVDQDFEDGLDADNLGPRLSGALDRLGLLGQPVDLGLTIPQEIMLSGYQQLTPALAIMGNFGWQNWHAFGKPELTVSDTSVTLDQDYDDTFHGAFGIQARIIDRLRMSMGFAYDSSAVSEAHRSPALPLDEQYRYAVGFQYDWSDAITIGTAYEFLDVASAPIDRSTRFAGTLVGDYQTYQIHFLNFNVALRL